MRRRRVKIPHLGFAFVLGFFLLMIFVLWRSTSIVTTKRMIDRKEEGDTRGSEKVLLEQGQEETPSSHSSNTAADEQNPTGRRKETNKPLGIAEPHDIDRDVRFEYPNCRAVRSAQFTNSSSLFQVRGIGKDIWMLNVPNRVTGASYIPDEAAVQLPEEEYQFMDVTNLKGGNGFRVSTNQHATVLTCDRSTGQIHLQPAAGLRGLDGRPDSALPTVAVGINSDPTFSSTAGQWARKHDAAPDEAVFGSFAFFDTPQVKFFGFALRGQGIELPHGIPLPLKNLDVNHYALNPNQPLYGSIPFIYAVRVDPAKGNTFPCVGMLWLNSAPIIADIVDDPLGVRPPRFRIASASGGLQVYLFEGPTPNDVLQQYFRITGTPFFPPLFSLGYHQCRWSYRDQGDVLEVNEDFDRHKIPCDAVWLDIDHTNDKMYFTWDKVKFPDPLQMMKVMWDVHKRRLVTITDPHIKVRHGYHVYEGGKRGNYFVRQGATGTAFSQEFTGHCWPGQSVWVDFLNPNARSWYSSLFNYSSYTESDAHTFSWIDMNEPSVFSGPELTLPMNAGHFGGVTHRQVHNVYGFLHSKSTFDGHLGRNAGRDRPFLLSRSFFAGSQRYAAVWTGDNQAKWEHLRESVPMLLSMSLCGLPFVGADVGGFFDHPTDELLVRWYQLGALYPFFRGHSHEQTPRREPWLFREQSVKLIRAAILHRYALLPYLYSIFRRAAVYGEVVWRPRFLEFPKDPTSYSEFYSFFIGPSLFAAPCVVEGQTKVAVQFPSGSYFVDLYTGEGHKGGSSAHVDTETYTSMIGNSWSFGGSFGYSSPLFVRSRSIVPLRIGVAGSSRNSASFPLAILIAPDLTFKAEGELYVDDGVAVNTERNSCLISFQFESSGQNEFVLRAKASLRRCMATLEVGEQWIQSLRIFDNERGDFGKMRVNNIAVRSIDSNLEGLKNVDDLHSQQRARPRTISDSRGFFWLIESLKVALVPMQDIEGVQRKADSLAPDADVVTLWEIHLGAAVEA